MKMSSRPFFSFFSPLLRYALGHIYIYVRVCVCVCVCLCVTNDEHEILDSCRVKPRNQAQIRVEEFSKAV